MLKLSKYPPKGFTLIELLVVVLIIGILAAIALPQYKMAVAKTKYAAFKNNARIIANSAELFYLVQNSYPTKYAELDIEIEGVTSTQERERNTIIYLTDGSSCEIWFNNEGVGCRGPIFGKEMSYFCLFNETGRQCDALSENAELQNRLCKAETNDEEPWCGGGWCYYDYK